MSEHPERGRKRQRLEVPVGLEKLLYLVARDPDLERRLLADRRGTVAATGLRLRPSEQQTLDAVADDALVAMIRSLVPQNPRRRRMMRLVAAAAASLAAGTATIGCDAFDTQSKGCTIDDEIDGSFDAAADTDSDTVDTETDSFVGGGVMPDSGVDGEFE